MGDENTQLAQFLHSLFSLNTSCCSLFRCSACVLTFFSLCTALCRTLKSSAFEAPLPLCVSFLTDSRQHLSVFSLRSVASTVRAATAREESSSDVIAVPLRDPQSLTLYNTLRTSTSVVLVWRLDQTHFTHNSMSQARRAQVRHRVTDYISQVSTGNPEVTEPEASGVECHIGCQKETSAMHRRHLDSTSLEYFMRKHRETDCRLI